MFGFVNIVSVYVGNALIVFDGRVLLQQDGSSVWLYAYIVEVFGVAKEKSRGQNHGLS